MKKLFTILAVAAFVFAACGQKNVEAPVVDEAPATEVVVTDEVPATDEVVEEEAPATEEAAQ